MQTALLLYYLVLIQVFLMMNMDDDDDMVMDDDDMMNMDDSMLMMPSYFNTDNKGISHGYQVTQLYEGLGAWGKKSKVFSERIECARGLVPQGRAHHRLRGKAHPDTTNSA